MFHVWNTGCLYQSHGQVIAAKFIDNNRIVFSDYSRMIDGVIQSDKAKFDKMPESFRTGAFQRFVMDMYLHNKHQMPFEIEEREASREMDKACVEFIDNVPSIEVKGL
jgi:hypothetical protein